MAVFERATLGTCLDMGVVTIIVYEFAVYYQVSLIQVTDSISKPVYVCYTLSSAVCQSKARKLPAVENKILLQRNSPNIIHTKS